MIGLLPALPWTASAAGETGISINGTGVSGPPPHIAASGVSAPLKLLAANVPPAIPGGGLITRGGIPSSAKNLMASPVTAPAAKGPGAVVIQRANCGTYHTGWVDDPEADVNPCPAACERGERLSLEDYTNGDKTQYEGIYRCYLPELVINQEPTIARAIETGGVQGTNCGTFWTDSQDNPNADVNPCPANCERGELLNVSRDMSYDGSQALYQMNYRCYQAGTTNLQPTPTASGKNKAAVGELTSRTTTPNCAADEELVLGKCFKKCRPGQTLNNQGICEGCPTGYHPDRNGNCMQDPVCAADEELVLGKCFKKCQPGQTLNNQGICEGCPTGYHPDRNGNCLQDPVCAADEELVLGKCFKKCQPGQTLNNQGICEGCPTGYHPDRNGNCLQDPVCAADEELVLGKCFKKCQPGQTLNNQGICEGCPTGYHPDRNGNCLPDPVCAADEELVLGKCFKKCQPGQTLNNQGICEGCPTGYHPDRNGNCLPDPVCAADEELVLDKCFPKCPAGQSRSNDGKCR